MLNGIEPATACKLRAGFVLRGDGDAPRLVVGALGNRAMCSWRQGATVVQLHFVAGCARLPGRGQSHYSIIAGPCIGPEIKAGQCARRCSEGAFAKCTAQERCRSTGRLPAIIGLLAARAACN